MMSKANRGKVKGLIREPCAWPGGYKRIAITDDGGVLCHKCVKENYETIINSFPEDGWHVSGIDTVEYYDEEPVYCDNCGKYLNEEYMK